MVTDGPMPDVGLPQQFGSAVTSGWDIKDFRFFYDAEEDALYVGINFFGIAGDADGDGNPSVTTQELLALGGQDLANLASSEAIQIQFDWNGDKEFDTIAGVPLMRMRTPSRLFQSRHPRVSSLQKQTALSHRYPRLSGLSAH